MPRFDKYDGVVGGFRATLAADQSSGDYNKPLGVGINASGLATPKTAGANSGFNGICILDKTVRKAGNRIDIMTDGEIVYSSDETPLTAGTTYYLDAGGLLTATAPSPAGTNGYKVGHTVEAWRLVVRFERIQA